MAKPKPYIIIFNAFLFLMAFRYFGGWVALVVVFKPYIAIPAALVLGAIAYLIHNALGSLLQKRDALTLPNLLAACAIVSLPLGLVPSRIIDENSYSNSLDVLFEDYVVSLVFYASLLQLTGAAWWLAYQKKQEMVI